MLLDCWYLLPALAVRDREALVPVTDTPDGPSGEPLWVR